MPKLLNSFPAYRKHRASGQALVTINGRDFYLGPHGTKASKFRYDALVSEWLATGRSPTFGTPDKHLTIAELLAGYLCHAKSYYGDGQRGEFANMKHAVRPVKELYAKTPAANFGPQQFKAVRQQFIKAGHSRSGINRLTQRIVRVFRWAASEGMISPLIPQSLAMVPGLRRGKSGVRESAPIKPVDSAVVEATLPQLSPVVAAMVQLQRLTGARPGEICSLRPCDVDRSTGDVWEARLVDHKCAHHGKTRTIYLGPKAQSVLLPFLLRAADSFCFSPAEAAEWHRAERNTRRKTPLSCGNVVGSNLVKRPQRRPGDQYDTQAYGVAISRACQRMHPHATLADKPKHKLTKAEKQELLAWNKRHRWTPNQLRHLVATKYVVAST